MLTSSAEVFRTRQAIRDLTDAVRLNRVVIECLGANGAERQQLVEVVNQGCRLPEVDFKRVYSSLLFAAAQPEEDFSAFGSE